MYNFRGRLGFLHLAEQLTGLFMKFGGVHSAKIKENNCYGFVTFEKRECAEAALSAGKQPDGIELLNGKQVRYFKIFKRALLELWPLCSNVDLA